MRAYEPATRRGWNGPYLKFEIASTNTDATQETRIKPDGSTETIGSSATFILSILSSDYSCHPQQKRDVAPKASHYQLDHGLAKEKEIVARFIHDPFSPASEKNPEFRLGLGMQPNE